MNIVLIGNPNCGKTTIYNKLTGKKGQVGNYAGVTVEKKESKIKKAYGNTADIVVDLPGAYSLEPYSSEEGLTKDYILSKKSEIIINILDGANFERSLFLTTQLLELNIPITIAINKIDVIEKRNETLDLEKLENELGCKIILINGKTGINLKKLVDNAKENIVNIDKNKFEFENKVNRKNYCRELVNRVKKKKMREYPETLSDKIDSIITNQYVGAPLFLLVMTLIFWISQNLIGAYFSNYLNETFFGEIVPSNLEIIFNKLNVNPILESLIVDGIVGGIGAVLGFLPLILVLFFLLSLLEDFGYLSRVALVMDIYFKKIGLSGKTIIPMMVGTGCAIPGVMSTRTIEDETEKKMAILLTPFIPCGAKLPIIALFSAVFFPNLTFVGPMMYGLAIIIIIFLGLILKNIFGFKSKGDLIIELPDYKAPSIKSALLSAIDKGKSFIHKATTIILLLNIIIWVLQAFTPSFEVAIGQNKSLLAIISGFIAPILMPLGFVGWQLASATITGFIAKEQVVATLGVVLLAGTGNGLYSTTGPLTEIFTPVTALSFLIFNLFTPPCFAAMSSMKIEFNNNKLFRWGIAFQIVVGYTLAMIVNQVGTLLVYGKRADGFWIAIIIILVLFTYLSNKLAKTKNRRELV